MCERLITIQCGIKACSGANRLWKSDVAKPAQEKQFVTEAGASMPPFPPLQKLNRSFDVDLAICSSAVSLHGIVRCASSLGGHGNEGKLKECEGIARNRDWLRGLPTTKMAVIKLGISGWRKMLSIWK